MPNDSLADLTTQVCGFADARDWQQFHSPKNLAAARKIAINAEKYPVDQAKGSNKKYTER